MAEKGSASSVPEKAGPWTEEEKVWWWQKDYAAFGNDIALLTRPRRSFSIVYFSISRMESLSTGRKLTCLAETWSQWPTCGQGSTSQYSNWKLVLELLVVHLHLIRLQQRQNVSNRNLFLKKYSAFFFLCKLLVLKDNSAAKRKAMTAESEDDEGSEPSTSTKKPAKKRCE